MIFKESITDLTLHLFCIMGAILLIYNYSIYHDAKKDTDLNKHETVFGLSLFVGIMLIILVIVSVLLKFKK